MLCQKRLDTFLEIRVVLRLLNHGAPVLAGQNAKGHTTRLKRISLFLLIVGLDVITILILRILPVRVLGRVVCSAILASVFFFFF